MTHEEARVLVKNHIKKRGNERVEVTPKMVRYWWNVLNEAVFYGKLNPPDEIHIKKLHHYAAAQENLGHKGHINIFIRQSFMLRLWFLTVLVHEMVHAWEHQHHTIMGHGKRFFAWKARIRWTTTLDLDKEYHFNWKHYHGRE